MSVKREKRSEADLGVANVRQIEVEIQADDGVAFPETQPFSKSDLSKILAVGKKPLHRLLESLPKCVLRLKAKELLGSAHVQAPSRLAVRFCGVPCDFVL